MNYIDYIFIIFLLIFTFLGIKKGFVKTIIDFASGIIAFLIAGIFSRPLASYLADKPFLNPSREKIENFLLEKSSGVTDTVGNVVGKIPVPEFIGKYLIKDMSPTSTMVEDTTRQLSLGIFKLLLTALVFIVILILVRLLFFVLGKTIKKIFEKVKVLNTTDKILGGVLGFAHAIFIVFIILAIITMAGAKMEALSGSISDSMLVSKLYQNNILLKIFYR